MVSSEADGLGREVAREPAFAVRSHRDLLMSTQTSREALESRWSPAWPAHVSARATAATSVRAKLRSHGSASDIYHPRCFAWLVPKAALGLGYGRAMHQISG
jgi:hypothetical protein